MPSTIGIRAYVITVTEKRKNKALEFNRINPRPMPFIEDFLHGRSSINESSAQERSWYIEQRGPDPEATRTYGFIHYGTFGFTSRLVDSRTRSANYLRQPTDVEEIPLFYEFWFPPDVDFGLLVLQSFQGRSCVQLFLDSLQTAFEEKFTGLTLRIRKIMPNDVSGNLYADRQVKKLTFIKKSASSDTVRRYAGFEPNEPLNLEVSISAQARRSIGYLGQVRAFETAPGVALAESQQFDEAVAEVLVGKKRRRVGIFGHNSDVGIIDITDDVVIESGHPTLESIRTQVREITKDFYETLRKKVQ